MRGQTENILRITRTRLLTLVPPVDDTIGGIQAAGSVRVGDVVSGPSYRSCFRLIERGLEANIRTSETSKNEVITLPTQAAGFRK